MDMMEEAKVHRRNTTTHDKEIKLLNKKQVQSESLVTKEENVMPFATGS